MRRKRWLIALSVLALCVLALPAAGQAEVIESNIFFQTVWARATAAAEATPEAGAMDMGAVSAAYLTIANAGGVGVRLVSAESPAAEFVEIHEMRMVNEVMEMRPVEGGLDILPGGVLTLEPGGLHLMLLNLAEPLVAGEAIPLALTFAQLDRRGQPTDDTFTVHIGAPILQEAPEAVNFAFSLVWARPADEGGVSAAYLRVLNFGDDDTLVGASAEVAEVTEIHEMRMVNDVMEMRPVEGGIPLAFGEVAALEPGGLHVMLMDLLQSLEDGSAFALTLQFESGAQTVIGVPVYDRMMRQMSGM
ncbi:MAG: copper chaperone PCu(A)C [Anaerolineae bacterium]|nr:copper chaperone PCu(A)C [Anaerolineae bacterium]